MRSQLLFGICLASLSSFACSDEVRDVRSYEITDSGLVGRNRATGQEIYWVDQDRILLIGAKEDDYVVPVPGIKERRFRLLLWNPKQKSLKEQHDGDIANGSLCFFNGYVRLDYTPDYQRRPVDQRWYVFEGPLGQETLRRPDAAEIEDRRNHVLEINRHTCREYGRSELPKLGTRVRPLLDGEFVSRDREPEIAEVVHWKYWPRNGSPVELNMTDEVISVVRYSRYLDSYVLYEGPRGVVFSNTVVRRSWLLDRTGKIRDFTPPSGPWMRGSTRVMPTKEGLFLGSHAVDVRGNGAAGGYLQKDGNLWRIISGVPPSFDVSPNGCEVALSVYDWIPSKTVIPRVKVINVCSRGDNIAIGEHGVGLSGGQKRLAIARAVLKHPRVLIFDEAASNLDVTTAERFAQTVNRLKCQVTVMFIAHQLPRALAVHEVFARSAEKATKMQAVEERQT